MSQNVRQIAEDILRREGGYVNDPGDPGGATNFGVTVHTMRRLGLDLDGDGDAELFIASAGQDRLLRNDGGGRSTDETLYALGPEAHAAVAARATTAAYAAFAPVAAVATVATTAAAADLSDPEFSFFHG